MASGQIIEPGPTSRQPVAPLSAIPREVWLTAAVVVFGAFMSQLDGVVVNVGLATITRDLGTELSTAQWVASGYLLALAAVIPLTGWFVRRYGGRRVWLSALTGFTIASLLCALAQTIEQLIALRVLQGVTGGLLVPTGQIMLARAAGPDRMGRVMSATGVLVVLSPVLGPVVGGLLIENSWRLLFLINVPLGILALGLGVWKLARERGESPPPLDFWVVIPVMIGMPAIVFAIIEAGRIADFTAPSVVVSGVVGLILMTIFVRRSLTSPSPLVDLRLLKRDAFATALITLFFSAASLFGTLLLIPLYLEIERGYSPSQTGLLMIGTGLGTALMMPLSGRLTDRFGGGRVSIAGFLIVLAGTVPMAFLSSSVSIVIVEALLALSGIGASLSQLPVLASAYTVVGRSDIPHASPIITATTRTGASLGTAIFVVIFEHRVRSGAASIDAFHAAFFAAALAAAIALASSLRLARIQNPAARAAAA